MKRNEFSSFSAIFVSFSVYISRFRAPLLIVASVLFVALGGYFAKILLEELPASQVLWLRLMGFVSIMILPTLLICKSNVIPEISVIMSLILRGIFTVGVALFFLLALARMGLAETASVFYLFPAFTYVASVVLLGERSRPVTWLAIFMSFFGVLLVLKPLSFSVNTGVFFAVVAAFLVSARIILYRSGNSSLSVLVASIWERGIGLIVVSLFVFFEWRSIPAEMMNSTLGLILCGIASQLLLISALLRYSAGSLAPYFYWEIVFALAIDVMLLGGNLDPISFSGVALIFLSGFTLAYLKEKRG